MEVGVILMREPRVILTKADAARVCAHMCVCAPIASPELHSKYAADVPDVYINLREEPIKSRFLNRPESSVSVFHSPL